MILYYSHVPSHSLLEYTRPILPRSSLQFLQHCLNAALTGSSVTYAGQSRFLCDTISHMVSGREQSHASASSQKHLYSSPNVRLNGSSGSKCRLGLPPLLADASSDTFSVESPDSPLSFWAFSISVFISSSMMSFLANVQETNETRVWLGRTFIECL